ncbi:hypothetical protein ACPV30_00200 [Photobacterium damselae]|uniref:Uncharacterized protein n=1 Tax=Photobacterium damselae TaxID=38293 RepID=A0A2T3QLL1_PHODM|nr:hypothetical protein [Photobacterium damselae]AWK83991.1 hypothetical protein BST98_18510 [Photobacterium damselae]PSB79663.1 hypothetical protein C5F62_15515 [Photobacterium damselae subsp. damselae]PSW85880.1 hypothetical protein CTN07_08350 [Photobacterium damselae]TGZ32942.1 hypothetical protein EQ875_03660 [Photobacterium damselae subsp. damselae]UKA03811.1 hypothetical protein IHC89_14860 [Photobacterium damselae subsp. damselae]
MNTENWLPRIKALYLKMEENHSVKIEALEVLNNNVPASIFKQIHSNQDQEAFAYWLDSCFKLHYYYNSKQNYSLSLDYLQLAYSKLQAMVSLYHHSPDLKRWILKKLDQLIVCMLEYCQQSNHNNLCQQSTDLINHHVIFMKSLNNQNLYYQ